MTDEEKITMTQALCNNDPECTDAKASVCLAEAESAILNRRYHSNIPEGATVPRQYEMLQCRLAARKFYREGGEGETHHHENSIVRIYDSANDEDLLMEVTTIAKVI